MASTHEVKRSIRDRIARLDEDIDWFAKMIKQTAEKEALGYYQGHHEAMQAHRRNLQAIWHGLQVIELVPGSSPRTLERDYYV